MTGQIAVHLDLAEAAAEALRLQRGGDRLGGAGEVVRGDTPTRTHGLDLGDHVDPGSMP